MAATTTAPRTSARPSLERIGAVRRDLAEAIEHRDLLLRAGSPELAPARRALEARIDELWHEFRAARAAALHGPEERIRELARAEQSLDRRLAALRGVGHRGSPDRTRGRLMT